MYIANDSSFKLITTFKIGGKIKNLFFPENIDDLKQVFNILQNKRFYIVGGGSNILVNDKKVYDYVISMRHFKQEITYHKNYVTIFSGCPINTAVTETGKHVLSGLEFLVGIPGLIGGAVVMNAGCFGHDISEVTEEITFLNVNGEIEQIKNACFTRRYCDVQEKKGVVTACKFKLTRAPHAVIKETIRKHVIYRKKHHPLNYPSAGGIFKNHQLLKHVHLKNRCVGNAELCSFAPNWILNKGKATFSDVMRLIQTLQKIVKQETGEKLELEVKVFT
jgi:UDP-N-acetylmuramate dehydrogenase